MGKRKKTLAFLIVVGGIFTFFLPLVTTDPPVMGITRWSAWNIVRQIEAGTLPPVRHYPNEFLLSIPLMSAAIYLLLVFALIALCFSCSSEVLTKIAVLGWFTSWFWRGDRISFEEMFYGEFSYQNFSLVRRVGFGQLTIVLLGVTLALFLVSRSEDIDNEPLPETMQIRHRPCDVREPEILDAEILPDENATGRGSKNPEKMQVLDAKMLPDKGVARKGSSQTRRLHD